MHTIPNSVTDCQRPDVAAWIARALVQQGYTAGATGALVQLPSVDIAAQAALDALWRTLPALREGVTLLGQAAGNTYVATVSGDVWRWTGTRWLWPLERRSLAPRARRPCAAGRWLAAVGRRPSTCTPCWNNNGRGAP